MKIIQRHIDNANAHGFVVVMRGVALHTQKDIIADHKNWIDKNDVSVDFKTADYWVSTNTGQVAPVIKAGGEYFTVGKIHRGIKR